MKPIGPFKLLGFAFRLVFGVVLILVVVAFAVRGYQERRAMRERGCRPIGHVTFDGENREGTLWRCPGDSP